MFPSRFLYPPVGGWRGVQSLPIDPGNQPLPLRRREGEQRSVCRGPGEVALMQTSLTKPDAGAIPDQEFEPILPSVAEGVSAAVAGRAAQGVLETLREALDAGPHVDRFDDQPDLRRGRGHGSCRKRSASIVALTAGSSGRFISQAWKLLRMD